MNNQSKVKSIRSQVLKVTLVSNAVILISAFLIAITFGERIILDLDERALLERTGDIEKLLHENSASDYLRFKISEDWGKRDLQKVFGLVEDDQGKTFLATPDFPVAVKEQIFKNRHSSKVFTLTDSGVLYRSIVKQTRVKNRDFLIVVSIDRSREMDFMQRLKQIAFSVVIGGLLLSILVTQLLVRMILTPIERLTQEVLSLKDLPSGFRIKVNEVPEEIKPFIDQTNELLYLLEISIEKNRRFASDIAHEIRSPVHRARMALEMGLKSAEDFQTSKEVIYDGLVQMERLSGLVGDMLFLSRVERGLEHLTLEKIEVGHELRELIDYYEVVAEDKKQKIILSRVSEERLEVRPELFRRAVGNLLENAIRYSPTGAETSVSFCRVGSEVWLEVRDQGAGFSEQMRGQFPERIYRTDGSRVFTQEGLGLGLSLVKAVMDLHGGRVELIDSPAKGSTLRLAFPLRST